MEIALVVLGLAVIGLCVVVARQHAELIDLRSRVTLPGSAAQGDEHDAIVIVIRNHHDVAAGRNPLARGLSALSPSLVRSIVHREAVREVRDQLEAEGIDADVRVRRVVHRDPTQRDPAQGDREV